MKGKTLCFPLLHNIEVKDYNKIQVKKVITNCCYSSLLFCDLDFIGFWSLPARLSSRDDVAPSERYRDSTVVLRELADAAGATTLSSDEVQPPTELAESIAVVAPRGVGVAHAGQ